MILSVLLLLTGCAKEKTIEDPSTFKSKQYPDLWCDYFYMIDRESGQVLMDVRSNERMYPASMTKVMTSIIALEEIEDPENVTIEFTKEMLSGLIEAKANRAGFAVGDEPTALDHIYGDLLPSGADCSRALAFYIAGDEAHFVDMMNEKALSLGMNDTHYVNTSGLHDDDHYTTCRDMMTLYLYCLENETFVDMIKTQKHISIPVKEYPKGLGMDNFVWIYINQENPKYGYNYFVDGFIGGKSGYTVEGQYTLVSNCMVNGNELVLVNAHGYNEPHYPCSIEDAANLFNYYRDHYEKRTVVEENEAFGEVKVTKSFFGKVNAVAQYGYTGIVPKDENCHVVTNLIESVEQPVHKGDVLGSVDIYDYDEILVSIPLVAEKDYAFSLQNSIDELTGGKPWIISLFLLSILGIILINFKKVKPL